MFKYRQIHILLQKINVNIGTSSILEKRFWMSYSATMEIRFQKKD